MLIALRVWNPQGTLFSAEADLNETYSYDGLIVAKHRGIEAAKGNQNIAKNCLTIRRGEPSLRAASTFLYGLISITVIGNLACFPPR